MRVPFAANAFVVSAGDTLRRLARGDRTAARAILDRVMVRAFPEPEAELDTPADPVAHLRRTGL